MTKQLLELNKRYGYTVFWSYWGNVNMFEIDIYKGRWNWIKHPMARISIQVIDNYLHDLHTDKPFEIRDFERFYHYLINSDCHERNLCFNKERRR